MRKFVKVKVNVSSQGSRSQLKGCIRIKVRLFVHGCLPCARLAMHFNSRRLDMCSQAPMIPLCQSAQCTKNADAFGWSVCASQGCLLYSLQHRVVQRSSWHLSFMVGCRS